MAKMFRPVMAKVVQDAVKLKSYKTEFRSDTQIIMCIIL